MSRKKFYKSNENLFEGNINSDDDEDNFENAAFLQDVPYSSSSLDRSSIGSIPWADDAIKQNQIAWERVESMLKGEEALPEEQELRHEIEEWQRKFPKIIVGKWRTTSPPLRDSFTNLRTKSHNSFDQNAISTLSLESLDEDDDDIDVDVDADDDYDDFDTPTNKAYNNRNFSAMPVDKPAQNNPKPNIPNLANILENDLRITSVPLALRQRRKPLPKSTEHNEPGSPAALPSRSATVSHKKSTMSVLILPPSPQLLDPQANYSAKRTQTKLKMPPILNVLESKRRFRGLPSNRSFVQLTHVQQVQSAAVTSYQPQRRAVVAGNESAWQLPLNAATFKSKFSNNRNSIVLPALKNAQRMTDASRNNGDVGSSRVHSSCNDSSSSGSTGARRSWQQYKYIPQWSFNGGPTTATTSATPSTGGRSISAAVHHPRTEFSAFFLPYAASKFK